MIEIPISSILAALLCALQVVGIFLCCSGVVMAITNNKTKKDEMGAAGFAITIGIAFIIIADLCCAYGSYLYATTPQNPRCEYYHVQSCIYNDPTANPFEKQPLHPLWLGWNAMVFGTNWLHGAVKLT